jgi:asparagine synthase (glutamine-hydrolysing)
MCGIIGQLTFFSQDVARQQEEISPSLIALMARRGPDDEGAWSDGQCVTLGFRRLIVLDLSFAGHQPMLTQDGRYAIVCNGEVYNFRELRRELEQEGVRFHSTGDTEVVLYALAHWGSEALCRFNGMFALGFYDSLEKRLLLARDPAGIKPLYYMLTPRGLVFASQYDQILTHVWSHRLSVSGEALGLYLRLGYIPAPYALLQSTHMLEPGTWLETTSEGRMRHGRFFEFPVYREPDLDGEEACEAVDAAVTAAVRRQLVSDVPVGTFLSGGIDSPLVAAKMRAVSNGTIRAFSMGTNGDHLDESTDAIAYAREIGVEHFVEHITPKRALDMLDDVVAACGEPFADYSIFPTMLVSRLARRHVKVILSGDGGDELFWGYVGRLISVLEQVNKFNQTNFVQSTRQLLKKLLATARGDWDSWRPTTVGDLYRIKHSHRSENWLPRIFPDCPEWPSSFLLFSCRDWELNRTAQWLRWNEFQNYLRMMLLKVDRGSMYHSLEVRVPLLDREVIDVATRVDWRSCLDMERKTGKLPLRYSLGRHVHRQTRTKRGFTFSMDAWLRGSLRPLFEELVLGRQEILGLPVNKKAAREIFSCHLSGQTRYTYALWLLLSLAMWEEHYHARRLFSPNSGCAFHTRSL